MVTNYVLRQNARIQMDEDIFKRKWMTMLAVCGTLPLALLLISPVLYVGPIALLISVGPLLYGISRATVECVEGDEWDYTHLFKGFSECFGSSVLLAVLQFAFLALWTLVFIVPGLIKLYAYSMAFYVQQDHKEMEPVDCITESRRMMDGYKWQLFRLDLSFLGWYLVGLLCLGVGILFVFPYHQLARANFYEALKAERGIA